MCLFLVVGIAILWQDHQDGERLLRGDPLLTGTNFSELEIYFCTHENLLKNFLPQKSLLVS